MHLKSKSYFFHFASKPLCTYRISICISVGLHPGRDQEVASILPHCLPLRLPKTNILFSFVFFLHEFSSAHPTTQTPLLYPILIFSSQIALNISHLLYFTSLPHSFSFSSFSCSKSLAFFHLFTHCCLRVLRKCYIMHFKLSQCMYYGYGETQQP